MTQRVNGKIFPSSDFTGSSDSSWARRQQVFFSWQASARIELGITWPPIKFLHPLAGMIRNRYRCLGWHRLMMSMGWFDEYESKKKSENREESFFWYALLFFLLTGFTERVEQSSWLSESIQRKFTDIFMSMPTCHFAKKSPFAILSFLFN